MINTVSGSGGADIALVHRHNHFSLVPNLASPHYFEISVM
jgi:hypothetical protein